MWDPIVWFIIAPYFYLTLKFFCNSGLMIVCADRNMLPCLSKYKYVVVSDGLWQIALKDTEEGWRRTVLCIGRCASRVLCAQCRVSEIKWLKRTKAIMLYKYTNTLYVNADREADYTLLLIILLSNYLNQCL